jgi:carbonic anhydrase/acetyltransferase-like protein (isoleucine patch superfamily)
MLRPHSARLPRVHPTAYIDDSAQVIGDVEFAQENSVPPRSLAIGSPAKVRRPLTDGEGAGLQQHADRYASYRLDYMNG